jgi:hypothetical protein
MNDRSETGSRSNIITDAVPIAFGTVFTVSIPNLHTHYTWLLALNGGTTLAVAHENVSNVDAAALVGGARIVAIIDTDDKRYRPHNAVAVKEIRRASRHNPAVAMPAPSPRLTREQEKDKEFEQNLKAELDRVLAERTERHERQGETIRQRFGRAGDKRYRP